MIGARMRNLSAFVVLFAVILTGCCQSLPAAPTPEPVTITFACPFYDAGHYQALADEFSETNPYVTVELQSVRGNYQFDPQAVDVFVGTQFQGAELQARGDVLDLSPFFEYALSSDLPDFQPGVIDAFGSEDAIWAVPFGIDPLVMYYNRDLFDAVGAAYPRRGWTWEDFLDAALAVNDPDASVFGYVSTPQSNDPLPFIYQHGGKILDDLSEPTRTTFDDPLTIEAVAWYADLAFEYNVIPTPEQQRRAFPGSSGVFYGIAQSRVGMWVGALSERGGFLQRQRWDLGWGAVALPRDARSMTLSTAEGYFISSHTQHREVCWRWITFISGQPHYRLVPARRSLLLSEEYEEEVGGEVAMAARDSLGNAVLVTPRLAAFGEILEEAFLPAIESVLKGDATPEEAMIAAQGQTEIMLGQ